MRRVACAALFLLVCPTAFAQMHGGHHLSAGSASPCTKELAPAQLQEDFQKVKWPAIGGKPDAQFFFSQGMTQYYGLNYEEAMRNFRMAKQLDPAMAMAPWGIALAAGPNINLNMTDACHVLARSAVDCALRIAGEPGLPDVKRMENCDASQAVSGLERDLINALKDRYDYPVGDQDAYQRHAELYSGDLAAVWTSRPKDKNLSTLYAESMMDLNPWDLYNKYGQPKRQQTITIVEVLKNSTGDSPEAIGANHFYIHAVEGANPFEGSIHPIDALPSADLLQTQVPASGHLVHMSSHIYLLRGDYEGSLKVNLKASNDDVTQYSDACRGTYTMYSKNYDQKTKEGNCPPLYYGHYLSHNYFFGSVSATFLGRSKDAIALACQTQDHVQRFMANEPGLQRYLTAPLTTMVVNRNWKTICEQTACDHANVPPPAFEHCYSQGTVASPCRVLRAIWYWARGMARTTKGENARAELNAMNREIEQLPPCEKTDETDTRTVDNPFGNNCAKDVLSIGLNILDARSEWADAIQYGPAGTIISLEGAVGREEDLIYDEPPQWFTPARESLGGAFLQIANRATSSPTRTLYYGKAFDQFVWELRRHPKSGRALYGKMRALQGLEREGESKAGETAAKAKSDFDEAWKNADYTMTDADLWPALGDKAETSVGTGITPPSNCACQGTRWINGLPPETAKDLPANDPAVLKCP
jgi:hypothetical protein